MNASEILGVAGAALGGLLSLVVALIAVIYRNDQRAYEQTRTETLSRITALEKQNTEQETRIATVFANIGHAGETNTRINQTLDKLDTKLEEFGRELSSFRVELMAFGRRISTSQQQPVNLPGTMPKVR